MKNIFSNYYTGFIIILLVISNIFLTNLQVNGMIYNLFMTVFILFNIVIIVKYKKDIKNKKFALISSIILLIFSKNIHHAIFIISNIFLFVTTEISTSKSIKLITTLMCCYVLLCPATFIFILIIALNSKNGMNDIYENTHYYCEKDYELYAYSAGAMDSFHYSIGKYYVLLDFGNIINISYRERNETTLEEYNDFLNNNNCSLAGE